MRYSSDRSRLDYHLTPVVKWLIGINVVSFCIQLFSRQELREIYDAYLVLWPRDLLRGQVWKLVTTAFATRGLTFLFDVLMLWFFVPTLERSWGSRRLLRFFLITLVAGNLAAALFGLAIQRDVEIAGMAPFIYASLVAFGVEFANAEVRWFGILPMKGKVLAIGVITIMLISVVLNGQLVNGVGWVAAMIVALVMARAPQVWILRLRRAWLARSTRKRASKYTVLPGGKPEKPTRWMN